MTHSFEDIKKCIYEIMTSPEGIVAREAFAGVVSSANPIVGVTTITANKFIELLTSNKF